jgi:signal transduction histidine kinase
MTFRTRLLLVFTLTVVASVGMVEWLVTRATRDAFERMERQRADALVAQFQREFDARGREIVRAIRNIAQSDAAVSVAISADDSAYYNEASAMARAHGLGLLELAGGDGAIISSAEWPVRFGYVEEWLAAPTGWKPGTAFLRREELPDGFTLALVAVETVDAGGRQLFVAGGQQLDQDFLATLVLPAGMRVLLYRNLEPEFAPHLLAGAAAGAQEFQPLIERVIRDRRPQVATLGSGSAAETIHALPLAGVENNLLAVLVIASSRRELVELENSLGRTGAWVAAGAILTGMLMAVWATARVTRPVRRLAASAGQVAAGNWNTTVEVTSRDEIGQLAQAFNGMTHELVEQRERLLQTERVAAWRELARRLAHELKNPLFPLQITVENMQRARESHPQEFDEVFREGSRTLLAELANLKQIIARFSDFAKMPAPEMQPVNLNTLVAETMKLFEAQFVRARVTARLDLEPALPIVSADPEQITRALRNLVLNAIDAMPEGGTLTARTTQQGAGARIEISDSGKGLSPEECERLFTPYYTTKTHGTGLGLAIVQSVISDHHGRISVESQPGKGTTFRIDLG